MNSHKCYYQTKYITLKLMGAPQRDKRGMDELFGHTSKSQADKHQKFIQSLLTRGYEIEEQDESQATGHNGELVSKTVTTILKPPSVELPQLKFEATETFGYCDFETGKFDEWEESRYQVKSYQKSAHFKAFNDPWQLIDLND